jgi:hypothetical protein
MMNLNLFHFNLLGKKIKKPGFSFPGSPAFSRGLKDPWLSAPGSFGFILAMVF